MLDLQRDDKPPIARKAIGDIMWCDVREARLRAMIDEYWDFVTRVLRDARTPPAEIDDQVQLTFIVAARRLDDVRVGCEKAFLFRIAMHHAAHAHRTIRRRREVSNDEDLERVEALATPEQLTHVKKMSQSLDEILGQMEARARDVFIMHAYEELDAPQIATLLGIPAGTVASRLRKARAELRRQASLLGDDLTREIT
jgi:RNA polymerase sigma-70 factor (ECF subfamily)